MSINGVLISVKTGNSCITIGHDVVIVRNIVVRNGEKLLIYQKFQDKRDFYTYPFECSRFRIYQVSNIRNEPFAGKLEDFITKNVM